MLYDRYAHAVGFSVEPPKQFELYADELELLAEYAKKTDKKEMRGILKRLAEYGRAKANLGHGPVRFDFK